jgi:hypothetical protein
MKETRLWCGALFATVLLLPSQSLAVEGPWCAVIDLGGGSPAENCSMPSFEICREEVRPYGSTSFCRQNPGWPGYDPARAQRPGKHRRRAAHD